MLKSEKGLLGILMIIGLGAVAGCGGSDSTTPLDTPPDPQAVTFSDFAALIEAVAPPAFEPSAKAAPVEGNYAMWTEGEYALLGKVIGSPDCDEPMSLYRNLNTLDGSISLIEMAMASGEGPTEVQSPEGQTISSVIEIVQLTEQVAIPADCQGALGVAAVDLETMCRISIPDLDMVLEMGFSVTDSTETVLCWQNEGSIGTSLFYATRNLETNQVGLRGAFWKDTGEEVASWIYDIGSAGADNEDFVYNMAWYSSTMGDSPGLGCVNGSGNRNDTFGLRYHQYRDPWIRDAYDVWGPYQQLFGQVEAIPFCDMNDGGVFPDEYSHFFNIEEMFIYADMPLGLFDSPFDAE